MNSMKTLVQINSSIVKVHGDVDRPDTVVLGVQRVPGGALWGQGPPRILGGYLFRNRTVLFLGCSLTDPDLTNFLGQLAHELKGYGRKHFALMRTDDMEESEQRNFERSYGIRIIGDDGRHDVPDIYRFLSKLKTAVAAKERERTRGQRVTSAPSLNLEALSREFESLAPAVKETIAAAGKSLVKKAFKGPWDEEMGGPEGAALPVVYRSWREDLEGTGTDGNKIATAV